MQVKDSRGYRKVVEKRIAYLQGKARERGPRSYEIEEIEALEWLLAAAIERYRLYDALDVAVDHWGMHVSIGEEADYKMCLAILGKD